VEKIKLSLIEIAQERFNERQAQNQIDNEESAKKAAIQDWKDFQEVFKKKIGQDLENFEYTKLTNNSIEIEGLLLYAWKSDYDYHSYSRADSLYSFKVCPDCEGYIKIKDIYYLTDIVEAKNINPNKFPNIYNCKNEDCPAFKPVQRIEPELSEDEKFLNHFRDFIYRNSCSGEL
jgi:hypothetical protein